MVDRVKGILQKLDLAIPLLGDIRNNVIMSPVLHVILEQLQTKQAEKNANKISRSLEQFQEIAACMKTEWKKDTPYMPHCDPLRDQFGTDELACKRFISKILDLIRDCPSLKKVVLAYYIEDESPQGKNQTVQSAVDTSTEDGKGDFLSISILTSARIFLIITLTWSLLYGFKNTVMNFYHYRQLPLISDFRMAYEENHSKSEIFTGEGNTTNDYIGQSARRYDFNIHEAVKETLTTINIQVAVWVSLATYIEKFGSYIKAT